ncbi:MAG TPA: biotin/lipoyl-containing protein [Actinomycetaceae bacterium]|nr:biotin/lipoyl-containing protein [Actinomycetaceae bacterium]
MNAGMNSLGEEDVAQLSRVMASLEASSFDYLELRVGDLEVVLSKSGAPGPRATLEPPAATQPPPAPPQAPAAPAPDAPAAEEPATSTEPAGSQQAGTAVTAPMMGIFYAQAEPGAEPFVTVGSTVTPDTTVGLIEVMKTFAPVPAGAAGVISHISARDGELVEFGEELMRVEVAPEGS